MTRGDGRLRGAVRQRAMELRRRPGAYGGRPSVAAIILAAGASSRMGSPKALLDAGGATFLARLAGSLRTGGCNPVLAVVASGSGPVADAAARCGCVVVVNPGGAGGPIGSLRAALGALPSGDAGTSQTLASDVAGRGRGPEADAFLFTPVDNPLVEPATVAALIGAWRRGSDAGVAAGPAKSRRQAPGLARENRDPGRSPMIVVPRCGARRGHPVLVDIAIADEFRERGLTEGARAVVRRDPGRVLEVPVADPGTIDDIDTPGRYAASAKRLGRRGAALPTSMPAQVRRAVRGRAPE